MGIEHRISIFRSIDGAIGFYECDVDVALSRIAAATDAALRDGCEAACKFEVDPAGGVQAKRVAEIVVRSVDDPVVYHTERDEAVNKPEVDRKPDSEAGKWVVQSLVFDKEKFTEEQVKTWLSEHDGFGNYGIDETENSYRCRQYDPKHFDQFRNGNLTEGVSAVYGRVKQAGADAGEDEEAGKVAAAKADGVVADIEAVRKVNAAILSKGVLALTSSAEIRKAEDGGEERYVLGLVLEPTDGADGAPFKPDTQDDVYSKGEVRSTAHGWMENYGHIDLMHNWNALGKERVRVLESFLAPVGFTIGKGKAAYEVVEGAWLLGLRVLDDDLWAAIKRGDIGAYSIGGTAERTPLDEAQ